MASIFDIHEDLNGSVCRKCINRTYRLRLQPNDCCYAHFPFRCSVCGKERNIVMKLNFSGKLKLLWQ